MNSCKLKANLSYTLRHYLRKKERELLGRQKEEGKEKKIKSFRFKKTSSTKTKKYKVLRKTLVYTEKCHCNAPTQNLKSKAIKEKF